MTTRWDPQQYLRFSDERERPFWELIARVGHPDPGRVVDLGCGPGTTTQQLLDRWPHAQFVGVDSSTEMIIQAQAKAVPGRLEFRQCDLREWQPEQPVDVLLCCATLQWVPDHVSLFPRFVEALAPGGVFAFQVPGNFDQPSHTLLYELARSERWGERLGGLVGPGPVLTPELYLAALLATGAESDVWETTYLHVLHGPDAVLEWVRGSALRPFITALEQHGTQDEVAAFLRCYASTLRAAYPPDANGRTVFPFRRIFAVATVIPTGAEPAPQQTSDE